MCTSNMYLYKMNKKTAQCSDVLPGKFTEYIRPYYVSPSFCPSVCPSFCNILLIILSNNSIFILLYNYTYVFYTRLSGKYLYIIISTIII